MLAFDNGVVAASVKKNAHGAVAAVVHFVSLPH